MFYTAAEIQENKDLILFLTINPASIYESFIKVFKQISSKTNLEIDSKLLVSKFETYNNFDLVLKEFSIPLFQFLNENGKLETDNKEHKASFEAIKLELAKNQEANKEIIYQNGCKIFSFLKLDGTAKDIKSLIYDFNLVQKWSFLENIDFKLESFNGCELSL
ncbi:hypothetical protein [Mycoplasmopsis gallinacea]|uniref:Uncharacterized protein n=1 Tax=Mycoplasmopsis gallinacea TaxID=29556 RepID=A0A449A350_9BACT|nr:hypothetical protein [Mycoplasmopsis gallinacea]VEU58642.1 Uncharacterised protein [Mycoplasmopsis gallinacea]